MTSMEIPGFKIVSELGRGGMASVYLAIQESLHRQVALKVMAPTLSVDSTFKERFLNEGRIVARLNHPNIVTIYDIGYAADRYYISMEYVRSGNLKDRIAAGLTTAQAIWIARQLALALGFAHARDIIHRDIKPLNILFRDEESAVITDFGIAKTVVEGADLTRTGMTVGTPAYMSPEQARGRKVDGRSDLYSLGVVFFEMLTGVRPYEADDSFSTALKHVSDPIPTLPEHLAAAQPVIDRIMAKEPEERYPDAEAFVRDLHALAARFGTPLTSGESTRITTLQTESLSPSRPAAAEATPASEKPRRRPRWPLAVAVFGLASCAAVGLYLWQEVYQAQTHSRRMVELLLEKADKETAAHQFAVPAGDNALQTFREVLKLEPDNIAAQKGIERIVQHFAEDAEKEIEAGEFADGAALVETGLSADPGNPRLMELAARIKTQADVLGLLSLAEQQLAGDRLTLPVGDNALESYTRVMSLDGSNQQGQEGLKKVLTILESRFDEAIARGEPDVALGLVRPALATLPQDPLLVRLETKAQALIRPEPAAPGIADLLAQADIHYEAGRYTVPAGENALENYRRVLALDPGNQAARLGIDQLEIDFTKRALDSMQAGDSVRALALIENGLEVNPRSSRLLGLRDRLSQQAQANENRRLQVQQGLALARRQEEAGKLVVPPGDNAHESYRSILAIDPINPDAQNGLQRILAKIENDARTATQAGDLQTSLALIDEALSVAPGHSSFLRLRQEILSSLQGQAQQHRVDSLLEQAKALEQADRLTEPEGDNALETYRAVLALDPSNQDALSAIENLVSRFLQRAENAFFNEEFEESLRQLSLGLEVQPDNPALLSLKDRVDARLARSRELERQINALLAEAGRQFAASKYTTPPGDNAYDTYKEVARLDPGNADAAAGVARISDRYLDLAQKRQRQGRYEEGLRYVQRGLAIDPRSEPLRSLERLLQHRLEISTASATDSLPDDPIPAEPGVMAAGGDSTQPSTADTPPPQNTTETARLALHDAQESRQPPRPQNRPVPVYPPPPKRPPPSPDLGCQTAASGCVNGFGVFVFGGGSWYEGEWRNGRRNGRGRYYYESGSQYDGEWLDNQRHGEGTMIYSNGDRYMGAWHLGKRHGKGVFVWASSGNRYSGQWESDKRSGVGTMLFSDGGYYEGRWRDGRPLD